MKEIIIMVKKMDSVVSIGRMDQNTKENLNLI